jgi:glutamyl endopeptidase
MSMRLQEYELEYEYEYEFEDEFEDEFEYESEIMPVDAPVDGRVRVLPRPANPSTRLYPFNAICYIEIDPGGGYQPWGSGNLIAPRVVITAGHVLREAGTSALRVTPGAARDSAQPRMRGTGTPNSQVATPSSFRTPTDFRPVSATDYGIIILPRSFTTPTRFMPLQARAASRSAVTATIAGFPGDFNLVQPGTMWRHSDGIETVATTDGLLRHRIDTKPGNSGSPLWILGSGASRIQIGVHVGLSGTRNVGVRITNTVLASIARWCRDARIRPPVMWTSAR